MAKEEKKSFVAYLDWFDALEEYTDAEVGQLMRALAKYVRTGEKPTFSDRGMRGNFRFMCNGVDSAAEKYENVKQKRREAGKARAAQMKASSANASTCYQVQASGNYNDTVTGTGTVTGTVTDTVTGTGTVISPNGDIYNSAAAVDVELSKIVQHYQQAVGDFPRSALDKLQKWRQEYSTEMILLAIDKATEAGKRSWSYINGILSGWKRDGLRTPGDVEANEQSRQARPRGKQPTETVDDQLARVLAKMDRERGFET
nr:MAG TPA: Replication initiation and membrane attachment [Caudoviricetes sp.]